jgi:hypothetical protein
MPKARTAALPLLFSFFLLACSSGHKEDLVRIDSLRTQAEQLIKVQSLMGWENWVFGKPSNQDSLYKANSGLFTRENIELVRKALGEEQDSIQRKRLAYLKRYLSLEYIGKQIAPLTDSVSNMEATARVIVGKDSIPYRQIPSLLATEKSQSRRREIYVALDPVLDSLNMLLLRVEAAYQAISRELGYESYNGMLEDLKGIDLEGFKQVCERVLRETEPAYLKLLDEQLALYPGLKRENFYRHDTAPIFRSARFSSSFPGDSMLPGAIRTFAAMGIPLGAMDNLHIDAEPRETKNPRAVCFAIEVPSDVRLSIKPTGGTDDYSALYHEIGHGLHFANTTEHAIEFKYMGEPTVTETFAFLSEYIFSNQAWLRQHTMMQTDALKDYVRFHAFYRLYFIRRYSAKFLYELHLHSGKPSPEKVYAEVLSSATGYLPLPSDEKRYLTDLDALYYSAGYLRAWFLEAQLSTKLSERFGENWFENPDAGAYLKSLWASGDKVNGDELAASLGYDGIHPDELLAKVNAMMLFSTR